jgi:hypothetical protein
MRISAFLIHGIISSWLSHFGVHPAFFGLSIAQEQIESMPRQQNSPVDEEVDGEIDAARDQKDFNQPIGGGADLLGHAGDLENGYDSENRTGA